MDVLLLRLSPLAVLPLVLAIACGDTGSNAPSSPEPTFTALDVQRLAEFDFILPTYLPVGLYGPPSIAVDFADGETIESASALYAGSDSQDLRFRVRITEGVGEFALGLPAERIDVAGHDVDLVIDFSGQIADGAELVAGWNDDGTGNYLEMSLQSDHDEQSEALILRAEAEKIIGSMKRSR